MDQCKLPYWPLTVTDFLSVRYTQVVTLASLEKHSDAILIIRVTDDRGIDLEAQIAFRTPINGLCWPGTIRILLSTPRGFSSCFLPFTFWVLDITFPSFPLINNLWTFSLFRFVLDFAFTHR